MAHYVQNYQFSLEYLHIEKGTFYFVNWCIFNGEFKSQIRFCRSDLLFSYRVKKNEKKIPQSSGHTWEAEGFRWRGTTES